MCGIAGLLSDISIDELGSSVRSMVHAIHHRGPDWQGQFVEDGIALGHARLSIIDLSAAGHQPMHSSSGRYVIVYNGEVYNFGDLRTILQQKGHTFSGHSDSEVILASYQEWGEAAFERWNGMFACAIWDRKSKNLVLARDRFGIKPLYLARLEDGGIAFASEIKSLDTLPAFQRQPDLKAVNEYLHYGASLGERTFYANVESVPPGCTVRITAGAVEQHTYYDAAAFDATSTDANIDLDEAAEQVRQLLKQAVQRQLVADVPVGIFLSGGVDSSAITAMAAEQSSNPVTTFSVGFDVNSDSSELPVARRTAQKFGTDHNEIVLSSMDVPETLEKCISAHDEPFGDPASLAVFAMSGAIKNHAKVVLQGDGGDEIFGGYDRYSRLAKFTFWKNLRYLRPLALQFGDRFPQLRRAFRTIDAFSEPNQGLMFARLMSQDSFDTPSYGLFADKARSETQYEDAFHRYMEVSGSLDEPDLTQKMMMIDRRVILPDVYFRKVDRSSMAHSIEVRVPLMDNDLVGYVSQLPSNMKVRGGTKKFILKHALRDILPDEVINGRKRGFEVPQGQWMRKDLVPYFLEAMNDVRDNLQNLLNFSVVEERLNQHTNHHNDHGMMLYKLLVFFVWARQKQVRF